MRYLTGAQIADLVTGLVKADVQRHDHSLDLTVAAVYRLTGPGAVDFGGSEAQPAAREPVTPRKLQPDDRYGWWRLDAGCWVIRYNEVPGLAADHVAFVQPHERLLAAGASHPSFHFRGTREAVETLLTAGPTGVRIKQNARVSKLLVVALAG